VRTPLDQTLALFDCTGRLRSGRIFNNQVLDRERVAELFRTRELLQLLKFIDILVQVRSQFCHRGQDQECEHDKRQNAPYTSKTSATIQHLASRPARPIGKITGFKLACYPTKMGRCLDYGAQLGGCAA